MRDAASLGTLSLPSDLLWGSPLAGLSRGREQGGLGDVFHDGQSPQAQNPVERRSGDTKGRWLGHPP